MGELHLEIARDRLVQDMKAKASMGKIEIGYRECILASAGPETVLFDRETAGRKGKAGCTATVSPLSSSNAGSEYSEVETNFQQNENLVTITVLKPSTDTTEPGFLLPPHLSDNIIQSALHNGALAALARGPQYSFPLHSVRVHLILDSSSQIFGTDTTPAALTSAARLATTAALRASSKSTPTALMEPIMNVTISVDESSLGAVVHDVSSARGGQILSLDDSNTTAREDVPVINLKRVYAPPDPFESSSIAAERDGLASRNPQRTITAKVPLKEMLGYLRHLRSLTGGRGTFVMNIDRFERMNAVREKALLREMRGM